MSYYPRNVRRLLIKAFKFTHQGRMSASLPSLPLPQACAQADSERVPSQGLWGQIRSLPAGGWKELEEALSPLLLLSLPSFEPTSSRSPTCLIYWSGQKEVSLTPLKINLPSPDCACPARISEETGLLQGKGSHPPSTASLLTLLAGRVPGEGSFPRSLLMALVWVGGK